MNEIETEGEGKKGLKVKRKWSQLSFQYYFLNSSSNKIFRVNSPLKNASLFNQNQFSV